MESGSTLVKLGNSGNAMATDPTTEPREVLASYRIGEVSAVEPAGGTAGKCWRVTASTGPYFLRQRGPRTSSREALEFDHGLRTHLLARGVPTAAPIATAAGETWVVGKRGVYELYPFVSGRPFRGGREELVETVQALAHFHQAAAEYDARGTCSSVPAQFAMAAPEVGGSERIDDPELIAAAFALLGRDESAMEYAVAQAKRLAEEYDAPTYQALPQWLIHGDYHPGNLLYSDAGKMAGIFDLDWACEHTRSRDLADTVYFFARREAPALDGSRIESLTVAVEPDLDQARLVLRSYHCVAPLAPEEARAIPLALRARWLAMRLEGSAKVPREKRIRFITRELARPLSWLQEHGDELIASVSAG